MLDNVVTATRVLSMAVKSVIKGVHLVPMGTSNAYLIEGDEGLTLIDAGFPDREAAVFAATRELGRSLDQLKHLIFTHGHPDHIGSAAAIVQKTGARTYMHPLGGDGAKSALRLCVRFSVRSKDVIKLLLQNKRGSLRNGDS
jgi:glyoxylase-like metal-dependent hydrolase (beta-lactamase superfamily II)